MAVIYYEMTTDGCRATSSASPPANDTTREPKTTKAQLTPSSRSAPIEDAEDETQSCAMHGKEVIIHASSVTISTAAPTCGQQHTRSLWASLCAGRRPDLHRYTKEELEMETLRDRIRMNDADTRIAQVQLWFETFMSVYMLFVLVMAVVSKDRIEVSSSFFWLWIVCELLYIVRWCLRG